MQNSNVKLWVGISIAIVIAIVSFLGSHTTASFGAGVTSCNGGNCTNFNAVDTLAGYWVNGVRLFNGSGSFVLATSTQTTNYYSVGGIDYASVQQSFTAATTTPCSISNPFQATSTMTTYIAQITVGTSTAATVDVATSTTPYATSTPAFVYAASVSSGAQRTLFWQPGGASTTQPTAKVLQQVVDASGESNIVIGPTDYVNLKTAGAGLGGYTWTGTCSATFEKP